jgi:hypothetical protein
MRPDQLAKQEKIHIWKIEMIEKLFIEGVPIKEIALTIRMGHVKINRIVNWIIYTKESKRRLSNYRYNVKQYYQNEDEMLIQDYKIEDLTGDEKLILEKL